MTRLRDQLVGLLRRGCFGGPVPGADAGAVGVDSGALGADLGAVDWDGLCALACREGLAGLLVSAVRRLRLDVAPDHLAVLGEQAVRTAARNTHLRAQLARIAGYFERCGVDLMALKGIVLIDQLYGRSQLRPMGDVDVMVRPEQLDAACAALQRLGCHSGPPLLRGDFFPRYYNERTYMSPGPCPVKLDVHVRPFRPNWYRRRVPDDALWPACTTILIDGAPVRVASLERQLIHLVVHAAIHGAKRLLWLMDIALFVRRHGDRIDWGRLADLTVAWGLHHPVRTGLAAVQQQFGPIVPDRARRRLRVGRVGLMDRLVLWHAPRDAAHPVSTVMVELLSIRGLSPRVGYLGALIRPQPAHLAGLYNGRHVGWQLFATVRRVLRPLARVLRRAWQRRAGGVA